MQCPIDEVDLVMTDRQGVEIDYCPKCRGVWLDRGELDKIIERGSVQSSVASDLRPYEKPNQSQHDKPSDCSKDYPRKKRKESFLGELFDF